MNRPLAVVALGGNALLPVGAPMTMTVQFERATQAAEALLPLTLTHRLVITHGSGPQVGMLAEQALNADALSDATLDVIDAEIGGMLGYVLSQSISNAFGQDVVTVLTRVVVDKNDPAFQHPTKPIGPVVSAQRSEHLRGCHGWTMIPRPDGFRRVVPSPIPLDIVELRGIRALVDAGIVPICAGGGGIPVVRDRLDSSETSRSTLSGIEGVVDKDLVTSLLAERVGADLLLLLTDVEGLWENWGKPDARLIRHVSAADARMMDLEAGSMAPKVAACCNFAEATGNPAFIGSLNDAAAVVAGTSGTRIDREAFSPLVEAAVS